MNSESICEKEVSDVVACGYEVYSELGPGFQKEIYQEAMGITLKEKDIPFEANKKIKIYYDGRLITNHYEADLVCCGKVIIEVVVAPEISPEHEAQLTLYLKATGIECGVVMNFGNTRKLEWKKIVFTDRAYFLNNNIQDE